MNERFIRKLMSTIKCSVCGEHYEANDIKVLGHRDNIWFLNVSCSACHSRALVAATIKEGEPSEAVTELTEAELTKFVEASPIGADDILDLHAFLQDFDGDFVEIFSRK
jgi:C4-type Zn-finger protein